MLDVFFVLIAEKSRDMINNISRQLYKNNKCTIRRDFPYCEATKGIASTTNKGNDELVGVLFSVAVLMFTGDTWLYFDALFTRKGMNVADILHLFECLLCFNA